MADKQKNTDEAMAADNVGQSGTDNFPTYQDEAGLTAADAGKGKAAERPEPVAKVELNHGEESPAAKAEREAAEKAAAEGEHPGALPKQMRPEHQDESVKE